MLTSCSGSDFKRSNISFKENKPDSVDLNSNNLTTALERTKDKFCGFRPTVKNNQQYVVSKNRAQAVKVSTENPHFMCVV